MIVDAGRMTRTQISEVTIARAVMLLEKTRNIRVDFAILSSCSKSTLPKRDPGSVMCANNANNTTFTVIRTRRLFKTNLNRFSWSSWMKCSGWKNFKITKNIDRIENIIHLVNEEHPGEAEAEKGAQQLTGRPEQTDVQGCYKRGQWMLKGLETQDGSKLKNCTLLNLTFITEQQKLKE